MEFFTLGHSTRSLQEFLELLRVYQIGVVADVRAFPVSQRFPHFTREALARTLEEQGIVYAWLGRELGGYRREGLGETSPNQAWNSLGFRNYADHMLTEVFQEGGRALLSLAEKGRVAIVCAERWWWRCHRRLISDWLVAHGHRVVHLVDFQTAREHRLPPFARVEGSRVIYPGGSLWSPGCGRESFRKSSREAGPGA